METKTPASPAQPELLGIDAVAELLGISKSHVARLADGGRMPAPVRLGRARRWRRVDLAAWIEARCPRRPLPALRLRPRSMGREAPAG